MTDRSPFAEAASYRPSACRTRAGISLPDTFSDPVREYESATTRAGLVDRSDRAWLVLRGSERAVWLNNLVTTSVAALDPGHGTYAFALNDQGRIVFDLNILARRDDLYLDLDRAVLPAALAHLDRYLFSEDVELHDATGDFARLGCTGPRTAPVARRIGCDAFDALAPLQTVELPDADGVWLFRHDFAGQPGFELVVPHADAAPWWDRLAAIADLEPLGCRVVDCLQIEAGIPQWGRGIDEQTLPDETGQAGRAVTDQKGCYLGQEIVERMRARASLANRLTPIWIEDAAGLEPPLPVMCADRAVGRLTALARHPIRDEWLGLAYLRTNLADQTGLTVGDPPRAVSPRLT